MIGSWINELKIRGIIHKKYNRKMLASVLNNEIKDLNLGSDGKTITNASYKYDDYRLDLLKKVNLLP